MFASKRLWVVLALLAFLATLAPSGAEAQKKKVDEKGADAKVDEQKADDVSDLVTAYQLAEIGRKNQAPEFLITAAGMLRRLSKVKIEAIEEKPKVELEKDAEKTDIVDKEAKMPSLKEQADDLFDEAEAMGSKLKVDLGKLIKLAKSRENTREVVGGPRTISRYIGGHQTQVFHFQFYSHRPCAVGFQASIPLTVMVSRSDIDNVWTAATSMGGVHRQVPGNGPGGRVPVTVRVRNRSAQPAQFQLFVN